MGEDIVVFVRHVETVIWVLELKVALKRETILIFTQTNSFYAKMSNRIRAIVTAYFSNATYNKPLQNAGTRFRIYSEHCYWLWLSRWFPCQYIHSDRHVTYVGFENNLKSFEKAWYVCSWATFCFRFNCQKYISELAWCSTYLWWKESYATYVKFKPIFNLDGILRLLYFICRLPENNHGCLRPLTQSRNCRLDLFRQWFWN